MIDFIEVNEHEKVIYLCGFYTGKAINEGDEEFARVYANIANDLEWALGIEKSGEPKPPEVPNDQPDM